MSDWARDMKGAYDRVFSGRGTPRDAERVLASLMQFCRPDEPVFVPGQPDTTAFNDGRRAVMLHIRGFLSMTDKQLREMVERYEYEEREAARTLQEGR